MEKIAACGVDQVEEAKGGAAMGETTWLRFQYEEDLTDGQISDGLERLTAESLAEESD